MPVLLAWLVVLAFSIAGCGPQRVSPPQDDRLAVFAGLPPVAGLVEQIGGDYVKTDVLIDAAQDPHTFEPAPHQILALSRAAIFFTGDMPFERLLLQKIRQGNEQLTVIDVTEGIKKRQVDGSCCDHDAGHDDHGHDAEHAAEQGEPDPHVWLAPPLLVIEANNIAEALCLADPSHGHEYRRNLAKLVDRLGDLDRRIKRMLAPYHGRSFYVFHPGFGYFADAYGLKQVAVEVEGRSPTAREYRTLMTEASQKRVEVLFAQPQYAQQSAQVIAEQIGGRVVQISGLEKDVISDIEDIATKIASAMKEESPELRAQR